MPYNYFDWLKQQRELENSSCTNGGKIHLDRKFHESDDFPDWNGVMKTTYWYYCTNCNCHWAEKDPPLFVVFNSLIKKIFKKGKI